MKRQALAVLLLLGACEDAPFDPSPLTPIPHGPGQMVPPPAPPGARVSAPSPQAAASTPEPSPAPLPKEGAFAISVVATRAPPGKSSRGSVRGTTGWSATPGAAAKGRPAEPEVRSGDLGAAAPALFARLDALQWHLLPSASGRNDGSQVAVTVSRGEVSHSFTLDGACDCPTGEAVAAIDRALAKLPAVAVTTAVSTAGILTVKKNARTVDAECQLGQCTLRGGGSPKSLVCYPTSKPTVQNCLEAPWKSKGLLVKTAGKMSLEAGRRPWAFTVGKGLSCELNSARLALVCSDGRQAQQVWEGSRSWFAVFDQQRPPEPIAKVFLLPSLGP